MRRQLLRRARYTSAAFRPRGRWRRLGPGAMPPPPREWSRDGCSRPVWALLARAEATDWTIALKRFQGALPPRQEPRASAAQIAAPLRRPDTRKSAARRSTLAESSGP